MAAIPPQSPQTSRGSLLERLFQVGALECSISHDIEAIQFYQADLKELENAYSIVDIENDATNKAEYENKVAELNFHINKRREIVKATTEYRRELMSTLNGLGGRDWCSCKHYAEVVSRALEIYCSTWNEEDYNHLIKAYEIWAQRLSLYFNLDYTKCFRCLSDKIIKSGK